MVAKVRFYQILRSTLVLDHYLQYYTSPIFLFLSAQRCFQHSSPSCDVFREAVIFTANEISLLLTDNFRNKSDYQKRSEKKTQYLTWWVTNLTIWKWQATSFWFINFSSAIMLVLAIICGIVVYYHKREKMHKAIAAHQVAVQPTYPTQGNNHGAVPYQPAIVSANPPVVQWQNPPPAYPVLPNIHNAMPNAPPPPYIK